MMVPLVGLLALVTFGHAAEPSGASAVMASLLFGFQMPPASRTAELAPDAKLALAKYRRREKAFKPTANKPRLAEAPEGYYGKHLGLERAIFSAIDHPESARLAKEYAAQALLYSEWEGMADSPISEAASADAFLDQHPNSPSAPFVHLFSGHRKLCAAGYLGSNDPKSKQISADADTQLKMAAESGNPVIRVVAEHLLKTRNCFP